MSDPVADLFHRAEGTTLIQARPIESILPRQQGTRRSPHGVSRLVAVVAAVAVVVAGTGLVVSRVIGNGGVRTSPPAAPSTTHSPSVVAPTFSGSATAGLFHVPSGFLDPADLGAGDWAADPNESSATGASPNLVSCEGAAQLQSATGPSQTYRGITTEGGEWLLIETVIQLDPTRSAQAATVLKAMTGCPARFNQVLLAADDQIVVFGRLQPSGAVGQAMSIALVGDRYLQLDTLPGGAAGNLDLPGQTQWLVDTAAKAVARATGVTPSKPAPNATAKAAAAKYRADPGAVVYFPSPGAGGGTPTGSQAGTPKAQVGLNAALLTAEELTGAAPWAGAVEPAGTPPVGGVQGIPHCSGSSMPVEGPAVSRVFRLTPSSGSSLLTWTVVERVAEVSPKQAQAATAMIAADTCTGEGSFLWLHLAGPAVAVVAPNSGGGYARLKVWSLVGTRVVSIEVYADSDPASASQALDPQWLPALVDAARRAAGCGEPPAGRLDRSATVRLALVTADRPEGSDDVVVGVLAVQGDVREHLKALTEAGARAVPVRRESELDDVDALVLPGGESTTIDKLTRAFGLREPLLQRLAAGMPAYGSCAGMILLADRVQDAIEGQLTLGGIDMTVRRNAFGRQVDSFEEDLEVVGVDGPPVRAVFIRAPWVESVGPDVEVLARVEGGPADGRIVAVRQGNLLATSFHPEITGDIRVHRLFVDLVRSNRVRSGRT